MPNAITTSTAAARSPMDILRRMAGLVRAHAVDMAPWAGESLEAIYGRIRRGAYVREADEWNAQLLARPSLTISRRVPVTACANKAIMLASWAQLRGMPWRLVAVGNRVGAPPHHVFPELFIGGAWRAADPTYPWNALFHSRAYPVRVTYSPEASA